MIGDGSASEGASRRESSVAKIVDGVDEGDYAKPQDQPEKVHLPAPLDFVLI